MLLFANYTIWIYLSSGKRKMPVNWSVRFFKFPPTVLPPPPHTHHTTREGSQIGYTDEFFPMMVLVLIKSFDGKVREWVWDEGCSIIAGRFRGSHKQIILFLSCPVQC